MPARRRSWASLLVVFAPFSCYANVYTVGPGGGFAGCTHATLQAAANAAAAHAGPDEINVSVGNDGYANQAIVVEAQDMVIRGGYPNCQETVATGRTRLSGSGGIAAAVMRIQSTTGTPFHIELDNLDLLYGDNIGVNSNGGGLRIEGPGEVRLSNMRIGDNDAYAGAGISIEGALGGDGTRLTVGDNVQIEDNQAFGLGSAAAGIDIYKAYLRLGGVDTVARRNEAWGSGGGGGIRVRGADADHVASVDIRSGGQGGDAIVSHNRAIYSGGGLHVGAFSDVRLYTTDAQRPVGVAHNFGDYGGGIFASGATARVTIWEGLLDSNIGDQGGGALAAEDGAQIVMLPALPSGAPQDTVPCPLADACNKLTGNAATSNGGSVGSVRNLLPEVSSGIYLDSATISGNTGFSLFADSCATPTQPLNCGRPASITVSNSRIAPNFGAERIVWSVRNMQFGCDLCTIASNSNGANSAPLFATNGRLALGRSIVWEPGRDVIGAGTPSSVFALSLLLHDTSDFPTQPDIRTGDPRFIAQGAGDFRLAANSPALDSAATIDAPVVDLAGQARIVDQPGIPNRDGPMDLGAYERAIDSERIFVHGFE